MELSESLSESAQSEYMDPKDHDDYSIYSIGDNILEFKMKQGKNPFYIRHSVALLG